MNEFIIEIGIIVFLSAVFYMGHLIISSTPINIRRNNGRVNVNTNRVGIAQTSLEERESIYRH